MALLRLSAIEALGHEAGGSHERVTGQPTQRRAACGSLPSKLGRPAIHAGVEGDVGAGNPFGGTSGEIWVEIRV